MRYLLTGLLIIGATIFCTVKIYATATLAAKVKFTCTSADGITVDECAFGTVAETTDMVGMRMFFRDVVAFDGTEQAELDAYLVRAIPVIKTAHSIP